MTVHSFARSKLPQQNMMNDVRLFSCVLVLGNSMRINKSLRPRIGSRAFPGQSKLWSYLWEYVRLMRTLKKLWKVNPRMVFLFLHTYVVIGG